MIERNRAYFDRLTHDAKLAAVCELSREGYGDHSIADLTGLSVVAIRRALSENVIRTMAEAVARGEGREP